MMRTIAFKVSVMALAAILFSFVIFGTFAILHCAAWFAFLGKDMMPFPWPMVRFFLFIGWMISALVGVLADDAEEPRP